MRLWKSRAIGSSLAVLSSAMAVPVLARAADTPDVRVALAAPAAAGAGSTVPLAVSMTIGAGWHVNSHRPAEAYLIPTGVALTASAGTLSPLRYPSDVARRLPFSENPLRLYEGTVQFDAELALPAAAVGGVSIHARVTYQACNDRQCFPPASVELESDVRIGSELDRAGPSSASASVSTAPARPTAPERAGVTRALVLSGLHGERFSLEALEGKVVVLDVWASWCIPCRANFPFLNGLQSRHAGEGVQVVGLTLEEDTEAILSFLEAVPARFPIVRDPSGRTGEALNVVAMPTTFLIDREGSIAARFEGGDERAQRKLEAAVEALASGRRPFGGTGSRVAAGREATGRVKAWRRGYLADPIMNLDGDPLTRLLREHVHSSKEGAAGDGGASGGGCGCN